jgi:hypothetical protein
MCGRKPQCAYASNFVFVLFDVKVRIFEGTILLQGDINGLIKTQYVSRSWSALLTPQGQRCGQQENQSRQIIL